MVAIKKWKTLERKEVLQHARMHLVEDTVELPDGRAISYLRHEPGALPSVTMIVVNDANELLVQREYSYPPNEIMWQLPGGKAEAGEDISKAARRETSEESGVAVKECEVIGYFYVNNRRSDQRQYVVVGRGVSQQKLAHDAEEFIESEWIAISEIKRMISDGEIVNMNMLAALNLWFCRQA
jgi:ADP-ribose pyrophosphatase